MTAASVSVVVIGRNEGERLVRCLESVRALRGLEGGVELIYADSASTDGSPARAAALGARVIAVESSHPTAALGRNAGWRAATGAFVLFLDGDTILHPDFARVALDAITADETLAGVWGHRRELHPERSIYNRVLDLDWIFPPGLTDYCGGDVLMRRAALASVDGYDATLIAGEEPELCRRLRAKGYRILHIDAPMTGHDLAMTHLRQYWRRAVRTGHAYAEVSRRFRGSPDPLWQGSRTRNLLRGPFWALAPVAAAVACVASRSLWPALGLLALLLALALRSAAKISWKSSDRVALFLYGLHSHLQQVPIFLGQVQFDWNARRGTRQGLIEYKGDADADADAGAANENP
jgi:cellulose synthase/poly-beta-1,6-N-acetylglucosamine synthase-like glycosyltransferase